MADDFERIKHTEARSRRGCSLFNHQSGLTQLASRRCALGRRVREAQHTHARCLRKKKITERLFEPLVGPPVPEWLSQQGHLCAIAQSNPKASLSRRETDDGAEHLDVVPVAAATCAAGAVGNVS